MQFPNFDPNLIQIGPIAIRWYALAYIAGILLGWRYGVWLTRNAKLWRGTRPLLDERQIDDLVLWLTLAILIGGRLGYMLFYNINVLFTDPLELFQPWHGGMSFHGAFLAVCGVIIWFAWRNKINMLRLGDLVAPCVPFGLFFGRLANFINGELWGRVTHVPWAMVFCNERLMNAAHECPAGWEPRHPSQLYEAGLEGVVLFLILRFATHYLKWLPRRGAITGLFVTFYGLFRIILETVRNPDLNMPAYPLGLTMGMMLSFPMVAVGLFLLWQSRQPGALAPEAVETPAADLAHEPAV